MLAGMQARDATFHRHSVGKTSDVFGYSCDPAPKVGKVGYCLQSYRTVISVQISVMKVVIFLQRYVWLHETKFWTNRKI